MDNNRQIRFLIPPFFLVSSLLLGAYLPEKEILKILPEIKELEKLIAVIATAGVIIIAAGFLIGVVSVTIMRLISLFIRFDLKGKYDAPYTVRDIERIWSKLRVHDDIKPGSNNIIYAISTFQNTVVEERVQHWLGRRWNAFHVSIHSAIALLLAYAIAPMLDIRFTCCWLLFTLPITAFLSVNGWMAFKETKDMVVFQTYRDIPPPEPTGKTANPES